MQSNLDRMSWINAAWGIVSMNLGDQGSTSIMEIIAQIKGEIARKEINL